MLSWTAWLRRATIWSIWASLARAPARLTFSPSASPSQRRDAASAMRAMRLSRIWTRRCRAAGSGRRSGQRRQLPELEMGQEFVPFARGEVAVFFAGPFGAAAGDERPVVGDHIFGVDRGVAHGGVQDGMPADFRGDMRGQPGPQGVGDEDSPEVMGPPFQRLAGDGDLRGLGGRDHAFADVAAGDGPVLGAVSALKQERHRRARCLHDRRLGPRAQQHHPHHRQRRGPARLASSRPRTPHDRVAVARWPGCGSRSTAVTGIAAGQLVTGRMRGVGDRIIGMMMRERR